jgi:hypothetical protein
VPGHAGKTLGHFLGADRITGLGQQFRFHFAGDDFRIDQNAVAVEDDEINAGHVGESVGESQILGAKRAMYTKPIKSSTMRGGKLPCRKGKRDIVLETRSPMPVDLLRASRL